jgi:mRNA interferase MazF
VVSSGVRVPDRGDLAWVTFDPQAGHEQAGRRPALFLSPTSYHAVAGLAIVCPVTQQAKGYPMEVSLPAGLSVSGVVLADHVRSIDWRARHAEILGRAPDRVLQEVTAKLRSLLPD